MPKTEIDYSNTVFYKIYCKDPSVHDLYIGHTTNFVQRKHSHKQGCFNTKNTNYDCKLYKVIRMNNGWDNWKMEIIAFHDCDGLMEAKTYEQKYFEEYKATLNSIEPIPRPKPKPTISKVCDNKMPENAKKFYCEKCHFTCSKESNWNTHTTTLKHTNGDNNLPKNATYKCKCGNTYKFRQGLYKHRKKCLILKEGKNQENIITNEHTTNIDKNDMTQKIIELVMSKNQQFITELVSNITSSNKDVMEKMMELMPQMGNQSHNNHNTNSNNNFNIQMFLNDHCKNAMNLTDFIESLPITADTYDSTIENGLTKTLTNMITNGLSQLDILERPIHCTDATRKTLYVKEANTWEKDIELIRMLLGIKTLARKQRIMINKWQDANEGWETDDYIQTKLTTLIGHSMTNIESDEKETSKIIRSISKNVYLDNETKQQYLE